jgi:hypothetical protein
MSNGGCGCGCGAVTQVTPVVGTLTTEITWRDVLGGWRVRWGIGRARYRVSPGLYRVGEPDSKSRVLVTANYKLTVDSVRRRLVGLNMWLLVLDTKGVNVWCAAGKGTFGTEELVRSIRATNLAGLVKRRDLVLPQLGAVGVAAHEVKRATGFSVHYGPVRARDLPAYLAAGIRATPAMRRVNFGWKERLVLTPVELVNAWPLALGALAAVTLLDLAGHRGATPRLAADVVRFLGAIVTGSVLVPLLLPWLPSKAFSVKGAVAGALWATATAVLLPMGTAATIGTVLLITAIASYLAMNFTGATTFTTYAGARLEVRRALPPILAAAAVGAILRVAAVFV